jgi:hypothetical protein
MPWEAGTAAGYGSGEKAGSARQPPGRRWPADVAATDGYQSGRPSESHSRWLAAPRFLWKVDPGRKTGQRRTDGGVEI